MLPQLLGEDSGPNQAVPMTLEFFTELVLVEEALSLEVDEVMLADVEDVEYDVDAWVVFDVAFADALVVGVKSEV